MVLFVQTEVRWLFARLGDKTEDYYFFKPLKLFLGVVEVDGIPWKKANCIIQTSSHTRKGKGKIRKEKQLATINLKIEV